MSTTTEEPNANPSKDIFISYSRRDKGWVDAYLTRLLKAAQVKFAIDENDFQIGVPLDESIRKLIQDCRYTLLVMTPDWVQGKWTHYESALAVQKLTASNGAGILAVKLKDCEVPPAIAPYLYLDLRQPRTRDKEIVRLLRQLGVPDRNIAAALLSIAKKNMAYLIELLEEARARRELARLEEAFTEIRQSNEMLEINKKLHDCLQDTELPLQQLAGLLADEEGSDKKSDWSMQSTKWGAISALCEKLEYLVSRAEATPRELADVNFIEPLKGVADDIFAAFQSRDTGRLTEYVDFVSRLIHRSLPLVNDRIVQEVKGRQLGDTVVGIYTMVQDIEFEEDVSLLLDRFKAKIDELVALDADIQMKVRDHSELQSAEGRLLLCNPFGNPTYSQIAHNWPRVAGYIDNLKVAGRYDRLRAYSQRLSEQLASVAVRDDAFAQSVQEAFAMFCYEMKKAFNKLDIDLLADCGKLKPRSDELHQLLRRMQGNEN